MNNRLLGLALLAISTQSLHAQATGRLKGAVVDGSGAAVTDAQVACRNVDTGLTQSTASSEAGIFAYPDLPIGKYEINVVKAGFSTLTRGGIDLLTGHTLDLRLELKVGAVTESVSVTAEVPLIQNASSEVQTTIDSRAMQEIPLNGRNPLELVTLTPGASFTEVGTIVGQQDNIGVSVNGLRPTDNNYQLDGANFNNDHFGSAPTLPNPDTLQEFTVQSSNFSARESRAGAMVQLSTRSGTNAWHGSLFEFLRDDALDARNFFDAERARFHRNQAGATIGGPIRKNRTFFFGSYQATLQTGAPSLKLITVPSTAQRQGDFTALASRFIIDPANNQPFPGNIIPRSRMDAAAVKLLEAVPIPDDAGGSRIRRPVDSDLQDHQAVVNLSHHLNDRNNLSFRYFTDWNFFQRDTGSLSGIYSDNEFRNRILTASDTWTITPRLTAVSSFSITQTHRLQTPISPIYSRDFSSIPGANELTRPELRVNVSNYFNLMSGGPLAFEPQNRALRSQMQWFRSSHVLAFGTDLTWQKEDANDGSLGAGAWTFAATQTSNTAVNRNSVGDAFASYLLGLPSQFQQTGNDRQEIRAGIYHFWLQDDWKVRPSLTLNLGVRWEPNLPASDHKGPLPGLLPGVRSTVAPKAPVGLVFSGDVRDSILPADWNNVAPRVGVAWNPGGRSKTVVRAGYGIYYRSVPLNFQRSAAVGQAFRALNIAITSPASFVDPFLKYPGGSPFPFRPPTEAQIRDYDFPKPTTASALDPTAHTSYTQSWNLAIERQLRRDLAVSAAYVGNHSIGIIAAAQGNPAVYTAGATAANTDARRIYASQGIGAVIFYSGWQWARYNALQVGVTKRAARGLSVIANYVFAKSLDNSSNGTQAATTGQPRNPFDNNLDKGVSDFDRKHVANISLMYNVPRLTAAKGLAGAVLNNWQVNSIVVAQSGLPMTVRSGSNRSLVGISQDTADQVGSPARPAGADPLAEWFNKAAFVVNAPGTFGTSGRNILRGPNSFNTNLSLFKSFRAWDKLTLQSRAEAFNALNRANFGLPTASVANVNYARVLTARDPRVIQLVVKVIF